MFGRLIVFIRNKISNLIYNYMSVHRLEQLIDQFKCKKSKSKENKKHVNNVIHFKKDE